jgi:hypothetical protein
LKRRYSGLKFSVAGVGEPGDFPTWISDQRAHNISELVEKNGAHFMQKVMLL